MRLPLFPRWQLELGAVVLVVASGTLWLRNHDNAIRRDDANAQRYAVDKARESRAVDTLRVVRDSVVRESVTVTHTVNRLDTLWKELPDSLHTKADTVKALSLLPVLHLATDSAVRACSEFQSAFSRYRSACDSAIAAKDGLYADLKAKYDAEHPGWKGTAKEWAVRAIIASLAYEAGKHLP